MTTKKFTVRRRVDAYFIQEAEVNASSAQEAAQLARKDEDHYKWGEGDTETFDARVFVTLDDEGNEIEATATGDL